MVPRRRVVGRENVAEEALLNRSSGIRYTVVVIVVVLVVVVVVRCYVV